jgi:cyclic pyranopterin phosphate synthase
MTHVDEAGAARMVDVGTKRRTRRWARAHGEVTFNAAAFRALRENRLAKGDAIAVARLAGIQAAKRTDEWIPLCHQVPLDHLDLEITLEEETRKAVVVATAAARWTTGVEMEAMVAVSAACLALYDMAKALDRGITLSSIRLLEKSGGKSGTWKRKAPRRGSGSRR